MRELGQETVRPPPLPLSYCHLPCTSITFPSNFSNNCRTGYKISKGTNYSANTTPGLAPANAAARAAAGYNFLDRDVSADTAQILASGRHLNVYYDRIWSLGAGVAEARRVQCFLAPAQAPAAGTSAFFNVVRLACRNPTTGWPAAWFGPTNDMTAADQAAIRVVDAGIAVVAGGHPKLVGMAAFEAVAVGGVPGNLMERLPEFLCQLGAKRTLADFN